MRLSSLDDPQTMASFRDLRVWQRGMVLADLIYGVTDDFPRRECYGLAAQMRKCAVSIPSNVAEGQGRLTTKDALRFLGNARGSLFELETQIELARRRQFISEQESVELMQQLSGVASALSGFINHKMRHIERRKPAAIGAR